MQIRIADFDADYAEIRRVRFAVFVDEQRVPESIEIDDRDPRCIHVLAFEDAEAIGTGRIDIAEHGKIGRVAVAAGRRRHHVGTALMERLHVIAAEHGLKRVWCNAQIGAVPFYRHLGYCVTGAPFHEAGIEHVRMERPISEQHIDEP